MSKFLKLHNGDYTNNGSLVSWLFEKRAYLQSLLSILYQLRQPCVLMWNQLAERWK